VFPHQKSYGQRYRGATPHLGYGWPGTLPRSRANVLSRCAIRPSRLRHRQHRQLF
jgi:hypothetical protein